MENREEHRQDTNDRISSDPNDKDLSVQEQIDACQEYGLEVVGVFTDAANEPPKS